MRGGIQGPLYGERQGLHEDQDAGIEKAADRRSLVQQAAPARLVAPESKSEQRQAQSSLGPS